MNQYEEYTGFGVLDAEPIAVGTCQQCGHSIYGGDDHYQGDFCFCVDGKQIHEECMMDFFKEKYHFFEALVPENDAQ